MLKLTNKINSIYVRYITSPTFNKTSDPNNDSIMHSTSTFIVEANKPEIIKINISDIIESISKTVIIESITLYVKPNSTKPMFLKNFFIPTIYNLIQQTAK